MSTIARTRGLKHASLRQSLHGFKRDGIKLAGVGGDQEQGFEQAFSSLGYAYIKDKAPRLLDYIIGFQLVDRDEDNTKALGIFGFKVGSQWLYIPIVFLNGDLKGHELLYIKNQDIFVPTKENWVNYVLSRRPYVLGEASQRDVYQLGGLAPNLAKLSFPPSRSKFGSVAAWAEPVMPMLAACMTGSAKFLSPDARPEQLLSFQKMAAAPLAMLSAPFDLKQFAQSDFGFARAAYQMAQTYPVIKQGFDRFYGPGFFQEAAQAVKQAAEADFSILAPAAVPTPRKPVKLASDSIMPQKTADEKPKVKIVTENDTEVSNLPVEDRKKVLHHGYLVKDERTGEELSVPYKVQVRQTLTNPTETGLYEILERPASFEKMLVVSAPMSNQGRESQLLVVRLGSGDKSWLNAHRNSVFSRQAELNEQYRDWFKALPDGELTTGSYYIALGENGTGTLPFEVKEIYPDGTDQYKVYKVNFKDSPSNSTPGWVPKTRYSSDPGSEYISHYGARLVCDNREGTSLRAISGELRVPKDFKFLKLKSPPKPRADNDSILKCDSDGERETGSKPAPIIPGDIKDIQLLFTEKTAALDLYGQGTEVTIVSKRGSERLPDRAALFSLIQDHGLTEKSALDLIEDANARQHLAIRIKYAATYPRVKAAFSPSALGQGPSAPAITPPNYGTEQIGYNNVRSQYPQEENIPVPGLDASMTDPRIYDPFMMPDTNATQVAQQASQQGQKEIFDVSMFSNILKATRQDAMVDRYLPVLMKAVDHLARLLLSLYWHGESFSDHYGHSEVGELEDSLRNTFESLGDTVLYLKERSVKPEMDDVREPSVDDAAKT